jgi:hypothetical protein
MVVITEKELKEIIKHYDEDCEYIAFPTIVSRPTGEKQGYDGNKKIFDHIYVDQTVGYCEDDYYGYMYFPIQDKYLKVFYRC